MNFDWMVQLPLLTAQIADMERNKRGLNDSMDFGKYLNVDAIPCMFGKKQVLKVQKHCYFPINATFNDIPWSRWILKELSKLRKISS